MKQTELCPKFEKGMSILSKRWTGLILFQLLKGRQRFCEIQDSIPVSGRLLSERLKELEKEGIVERDVFPEVPIRVEYSLTEKGEAVAPIIEAIQTWAEAWIKVD
ncbi:MULTISPECIES: winged helix-turn-helix transcriptional regulator [unclassified Sporolactobacillus]|uniref:winged helix-turn-helix transcriptional regulator n=1 Tax=unclassified Sporolactobacillus TaxID=2628533 RepID=UPI002367C7F7|nr:helix-turn-helix domain-containing protein [Sporolactobacillus sp. CQH2019]MDD9148810.1 helix-turn-helix domain-containing protein [Sporolactobacillus sp. CQH2019]